MAAKLQCEICGGKLIGKPGGVFECDSCGMEYDTAWAKAKIQEIQGTVKVEGTVEVQGTVKVEGAANKESLLKRGNMALEDGKWAEADTFFERVLDADPENGEAWLGKLLKDLRLPNMEAATDLELDGSTSNDEGTLIISWMNYRPAMDSIREEPANNDSLSSALYSIAKADGNDYQGFMKALKDSSQRVHTTKELLLRLQRAGGKAEVLQDFGFPLSLKSIIGLDDYKKFEQFAEPELVSKMRSKLEKAEQKTMARLHREKEERERALREAEEKERQAQEEKQRELQRNKNILAPAMCKARLFKGMLSCGSSYVAGLNAEGKAISTHFTRNASFRDKGQCNVEDWNDIVAISAGSSRTVGLKENGTVVAAGQNDHGQCNVQPFKDIVAVLPGESAAIGLRRNGTIVKTKYTGEKNAFISTPLGTPVSSWTDVIAISGQGDTIFGLKTDGTVVMEEYGRKKKRDLSKWQDIVDLSYASGNLVGLRADGTVLYDGENQHGEGAVEQWTDIVSVAAGSYHTVGLREDGTVVTTRFKSNTFDTPKVEYKGECDVEDWKDIVAIDAGYQCTLGLTSDGRVRMAGSFDAGETAALDWKLFKSADTIQDERQTAKRQKEIREENLSTEKSALNAELANLKGLFSGKRRKEIEARLAEIDAELKKLNG